MGLKLVETGAVIRAVLMRLANSAMMSMGLSVSSVRLTLPPGVGGVVEGQGQRDDGRHLQDDQGDVLQGLPHQVQEGLWLLGRDMILAEPLPPSL